MTQKAKHPKRNDKKNGSIGMNILGLMVGGAMTAVSAILFAAGGATERIVTGKEL